MNDTETYVRAVISKNIKQEAEKALKKMGFSLSDYIRMSFIRLIDEQAIPFKVKVPNQATLKAIEETEEAIQKGQLRSMNKKDILNELRKS